MIGGAFALGCSGLAISNHAEHHNIFWKAAHSGAHSAELWIIARFAAL
jgi:hypothetical protein